MRNDEHLPLNTELSYTMIFKRKELNFATMSKCIQYVFIVLGTHSVLYSFYHFNNLK